MARAHGDATPMGRGHSTAARRGAFGACTGGGGICGGGQRWQRAAAARRDGAHALSISCHPGKARVASMNVLRVTQPVCGAIASSNASAGRAASLLPPIGVPGRLPAWSMRFLKRHTQKSRPRRAQSSPIAALGSDSSPPGWCMSLVHSASSSACERAARTHTRTAHGRGARAARWRA